MNKIYLTLLLLISLSLPGFSQDDLIRSIKKDFAPDSRVAVWDISADTINGELILSGKTDKLNAYSALKDSLKKENINFIDSIKILPLDKDYKWGVVCLPIVHLRTNPRHAAELASQALMGTPVKVLEGDDEWLRIQTPDNYIAWVVASGIVRKTDEQIKEWRSSRRYIVTAISSHIYKDEECSEVVSDLVLGDILEISDINKNFIKLVTPDGRVGFVCKNDMQDLVKWTKQSFNPDLIVNTAKQLMGSCYTWGGTSTKGVDCSGLTKTCYFANGVILQRDASQQVLYGKIINPKDWQTAKKGDLLYFGTESGRITHTAIYMSDGYYIHSSGSVKINSVDPSSKSYLPNHFLSINRINGNVDSAGIYSVKNHPWYFEK